MIDAADFISAAKKFNFGLYTGVPCSLLQPFINYAIDATDLHYIGAANEGDAVAIATGAELGHLRSVVMMQNSGLGNAVNPLTSLNHTCKLPILLIVTLRGDPAAAPDEPQHHLMGRMTQPLLDLMEISWEYFPEQLDQIEPVLNRACQQMETGSSYALVMRKGAVAPYALQSTKLEKAVPIRTVISSDLPAHHTRYQMLQAIQAAILPQDLVLTTTGFTSRELYAIADRANQFYMVGSMGCVSSLGLGLALAQPQRRTIVLDGDGAALMRLGAWTTIGYERPANLRHILLDNQCHESTGRQLTASHSIDFCAIAAACGYASVAAVNQLDAVQNWLNADVSELGFLHVKIEPGTVEALPRPQITPAQVAARLRAEFK